MYQFFSVAFNAAPGVTYLTQLQEAVEAGLSTQQIVNIFTTKTQFTSVYPSFLTSQEFANKLVDAVIKSSASPAAKAQAATDIVAALDFGFTRGDVVFQVFSNLANTTDPANPYFGVAQQFTKQIAVAKYYTETLLGNSTDVGTLQGVIKNVTDASDVSSNSAIQSLIDSGTAVSQTYTLSANVDNIVGTAANDQINGTATGAFGILDAIDGGAGVDTLSVFDTAAISTAPTQSIRNIEVATLTSALGITADTTGWTGLNSLTTTSVAGASVNASAGTSVTVNAGMLAAGPVSVNGGNAVNVVATGSTTGTITVGNVTAPVGAVTVSNASTGAVSMGNINVTGGSTVAVSQTAGNAINTTTTLGAVTVTGSALTTAVTVNNAAAATAGPAVAGVTTNAVTITDINSGSNTQSGTITSATVNNFTTLGMSGTALSNLSVRNGSGNIIIDNSGLTTPTNRTLNLTVNGMTGGTLDDADVYTTLNVTTAGAASRLANITTGAVTQLNVSGTNDLTLTSTAGLTAVQGVTVTGAVGLRADLSGASVQSISTAGSTGNSTVTLNGANASFAGGVGVDTVTATAVAANAKSIDLGGGNDTLTLNTGVTTAAIAGGQGTDTLKMSASNAALASATPIFNTFLSGFEKLDLSAATNQTIDLANLGGIGDVTTSGGNGLTLNNLASGSTLNLTGAGTAYTVGNAAFLTGTNDTLNLTLTDGSGAGVSFASTGLSATGVENVNIVVSDTQALPSGSFNNTFTLLGNSAKSVGVRGNAGVTLTATDTALTSLDASGITLGGFTFTSGALANAATINGSAAGTNSVNFTAATAAVTYTGGTGADSVTANNAQANVVSLGNGTNSFTGGDGGNTVTSGTGNDTVMVGSGNNNATLGNGTNSFTATSGNNAVTTGTGNDTVSVGSGNNIANLGDGNNEFTGTSGNNTVTTGAGDDTVMVTSGNNTVNLGNGANSFTATSGNNNYTGGTGVDLVTVGGGVNTIFTGAGADVINLTAVTANVNTYTTVSDFAVGDQLSFADLGDEVFNSTKVTLGNTAVFQDYANAVIAAAGDASMNGALGWFQFAGDTYVVESRHNAAQNASFVNGTDMIVKLTGLLDLSTAQFDGTGLTSTLTAA